MLILEDAASHVAVLLGLLNPQPGSAVPKKLGIHWST
jgi:hypothetical protein